MLALLAAFVLWGSIVYRESPGDDLSASYLGCRLIAAGQGGSLYSHHPELFHVVDDPVWPRIASDAGFSGFLHPYVQTPLWAHVLQPLCSTMTFPAFNALFVALVMLSLAATVWLVARYWTPALRRPLWIGSLVLGLAITEPFNYAMFLTQTHALFMLLTVAAVILARREQGIWAGALLAVAAAVKITPAFIAVYWLVNRQWRAAASFALLSLAMLMVTALLAGPQMMLAYVEELRRISDILLVSYNNQSFAAWWTGSGHLPEEIGNWRMHTLPISLKLVSLLLVVFSVLVGGIMDRTADARANAKWPIGAAFAIVGTTMFTPIAWTHYYIVLVLPAMLMLDAIVRLHAYWLAPLLLAALALNVYPIAIDPVTGIGLEWSLGRSHFYAGLVCLFGLALLASSTHFSRGLNGASFARA